MTMKNTTALLKRLRSLMGGSSHMTETLHAYIIPSDDAHQSEYIADCDKRRAFISGFTGSAGTAIVTTDSAAMWTDSRYWLQASSQMDSGWQLMKDGLPSTPSQGDWLCKILPQAGRVGVDPFLLPAASWQTLDKQLSAKGHMLVPVSQNLIDLCWDDQPKAPTNPIFIQPLKYAGVPWQDKVKQIREKMKTKEASVLVVTALDEVAWLFNLRGSDIQCNPCFYSYAIITMDKIMLFVDEKKADDSVRAHLASENGNVKATMLPYGDILRTLEDIAADKDKTIWVSKRSSQALFNTVPEKQRVDEICPIALMKALKNPTELAGMKHAHIKDAVALCEYFHWLESEVPKGTVDEISGADYLQKLRQAQEDYIGSSFDTISSVGSNGAIIHYRACDATNKKLTTEEVYLCDSGAQYRDGTTDVTRTMHFGTPTKHQQECFTRVLKGHIALESIIFPNGVKGLMLDSFARQSLWQVGLDYGHGTGHGVGSFLNVHEGPCGISYRPRADDVPLQENMILSNEPGYYEDGSFGIRIESLIQVIKKETKHNFRDKGFLTFEPITFAPIQKKMLLPELLTESEIAWLNDYHQKCMDLVGPALLQQGKNDVYNWLVRETKTLG